MRFAHKNPSGGMKWGAFISGLCTMLGSFLVTMQSSQMNPPYTFDIIQTRVQTRVDAFVR